jgi:AbrB family looped-hinge helix DNA binding protein
MGKGISFIFLPLTYFLFCITILDVKQKMLLDKYLRCTMFARILKKGQIIIPKEIRKKTGISPGDKVEIKTSEEGIVILPLRTSHTENTKGIIKGRLSLEELEEIYSSE